MTKAEIVAELARQRVVEDICNGIAGSKTLTADLKDLVQIIHLALLEYPEEKIVALYEQQALRYFIIRIARNQYSSRTSPYYHQIREFDLRNDGEQQER